jgi:hypothetical protein
MLKPGDMSSSELGSEHALIAKLLIESDNQVLFGRRREQETNQEYMRRIPPHVSWMPVGCMTINLVLFAIIASSVFVSIQVHFTYVRGEKKGA